MKVSGFKSIQVYMLINIAETYFATDNNAVGLRCTLYLSETSDVFHGVLLTKDWTSPANFQIALQHATQGKNAKDDRRCILRRSWYEHGVRYSYPGVRGVDCKDAWHLVLDENIGCVTVTLGNTPLLYGLDEFGMAVNRK